MNYKYNEVLLVILIWFIISCNNNKTEEIVTPSEIDESLGYLPLNIENTWHYKSEHNSFEQEVKVS